METRELESRLVEVGNRLSSRPLESVDVLLSLLDQTESLLTKVEQSPSESMSNSLSPAVKALIAEEFLRHSDRDVRVAVVACLSEITRITAPEAPYNDEEMKEIFQQTVEAFENLDDMSSRSSTKRFAILETVAKVRSCVVMLDLECDDLILEMFRLFLKTIRPNHAPNVFSCMTTIMRLVIEESEEISQDLVSCLLESVKLDAGVSLDARKLGEFVLKSCAEKLKPYLKELSHPMSEYSKVVASVCQGTTAPTMEKENNVSGEIMVEDSKLSERTISDEFPQESAKTEQEVVYPDEHAEAAEKSSKQSTTNKVCTNNGKLDGQESLLKETPVVSFTQDQLKMISETDGDVGCVDINPDLLHDKANKASGTKASLVQTKDTVDHTHGVHLETEAKTSNTDEKHSAEVVTEVSTISSPVHAGVSEILSDKPKKASDKKTAPVQMNDTVDRNFDARLEKEAETPNKDEDHSAEAGTGVSEVPSSLHVGVSKFPSDKSQKENNVERSSVEMKDIDHTVDLRLAKEAEISDKGGQHSPEAGIGLSQVQPPVRVGVIKIPSNKSKKASVHHEKDSVDHTLRVHHEKESERSDEAVQHYYEAGTKVSKVPSSVNFRDPDATGTKRGRPAKSSRKHGGGAVAEDLASFSGRKEQINASQIKSKKLLSKGSDAKEETDDFSDSESSLKEPGEKYQPVDTDKTLENALATAVGSGVSEFPSPANFGDPDATGTKRGRPAKSSRKRSGVAFPEDPASFSGRKEHIGASEVKNKNLLSKVSEAKKETGPFGDSERRPLKGSGKKAEPVDTDQTLENVLVTEAGAGGSEVPSPVNFEDPDATGTKRGRPAKSSRKRRRSVVAEDPASFSGRKEHINASEVKGKRLMSKGSDAKKEADTFSDSEKRSLKRSSKKSQQVDTDQTLENASVTEAGTGLNDLPSPTNFGDPDTTRIKRGRPAKSSRKRGGGAVTEDPASFSGRKEHIDSSVVKSKKYLSKDSDAKKETDTFSDSERSIKGSGKKSKPLDTDQTLENTLVTEADTGVIEVPSPVNFKDPDATGTKRGRPAKSSRKRGGDAVVEDPASFSGRKEHIDASEVKSKKLLSKGSDAKKETDTFSDSEKRPLKGSGKKSQSLDTDQTLENALIKSRRQKNKRDFSESKDSQGESSRKQKLKQQDKLMPKKDGPEQGVKLIISSPKSVKKSEGQDNLESPNIFSGRKRSHGAEEVVETPARNKLDGSIVGSKIEVWWPVDKKYYEGVVDSYDPSTKRHKVLYNDGDIEVLLLKKEQWKFVNNDSSDDIASPDGSLEESRRKRVKTSTNSVLKGVNVEASSKRTGSGSVAKRKGRPPKISTHKIDELHDDNSPKATNEQVDTTASMSASGGSKSGTKLNRHNTPNMEKLNSKTVNSLLEDNARPSRKSRDETNGTHSKHKSDFIFTSSKGKKDEVPKEKLSEVTPKTVQRSKSSITSKYGDSKANGTNIKAKSVVQETESSVGAFSGKGEILEEAASSPKKRKRKGRS